MGEGERKAPARHLQTYPAIAFSYYSISTLAAECDAAREPTPPEPM
jgi:hypothetical protein